MAKGKKVMFVFILEVLNGDGPKPGSFWTAPKKRCHRLLLPKLPKVPPHITPAPLASLAVLETSGQDMMTGVEPSAPIDPPPPIPTPSPSVPAPAPALIAPRVETLAEMLVLVPFPQEFAHLRIVSWGYGMHWQGFSFNRVTLAWIVNEAGHTGERALHVLTSLPFLLSPPPPSSRGWHR